MQNATDSKSLIGKIGKCDEGNIKNIYILLTFLYSPLSSYLQTDRKSSSSLWIYYYLQF